MDELKLLIAGGGTGGHLFTGIAVAQQWTEKGGRVLFVGTPLGMEKELVPQYNFNLEMIPVSRLKGSGLVGKIKTLIGLPGAFLKSYKVVRKFNPDIVLGIGGYASGPAVLTAKFMGIPTAIVDQNSIPGLTNRILSKFVKRVYLTFEMSREYIRSSKVKVTGNPVLKSRIPKTEDFSVQKDVLLVCGGSQGARAINQAFVGLAKDLKRDYPQLKIVHQTGQTDFEEVIQSYKKEGLDNIEVSPFFKDMTSIYKRTKVMVGRSGAGSVTESTLWGIPSILIPYPIAADDHQKKNAQEVTDHHAGILLEQKDLTSESLRENLDKILKDEAVYQSMVQNSLKIGKPKATETVTEDLMQLAVQK